MSSIDLDSNVTVILNRESRFVYGRCSKVFYCSYCRTPCVKVEFDEEATTEILGSLVI